MTIPTFTRGEWEDIGDGNRVRRVFRDGALDALDWQHGCTIPCDDYIPLSGLKGWTLQAEQPLTISPSLLCPACKRHGFIQHGKWVPA